MSDVDVFSALANPVRREILHQLQRGPRGVTDLASRFDLGRPAVSEHLQVLRRARLVREEPRGRERHYHLDPRPLAEVDAWLQPFHRFWRERLDALGRLLDEEDAARARDRHELDVARAAALAAPAKEERRRVPRKVAAPASVAPAGKTKAPARPKRARTHTTANANAKERKARR